MGQKTCVRKKNNNYQTKLTTTPTTNPTSVILLNDLLASVHAHRCTEYIRGDCVCPWIGRCGRFVRDPLLRCLGQSSNRILILFTMRVRYLTLAAEHKLSVRIYVQLERPQRTFTRTEAYWKGHPAKQHHADYRPNYSDFMWVRGLEFIRYLCVGLKMRGPGRMGASSAINSCTYWVLVEPGN